MNFVIKDVLHDMYAGVKPVPMLPLNTLPFKYPTKTATQVIYMPTCHGGFY